MSVGDIVTTIIVVWMLGIATFMLWLLYRLVRKELGNH